jgi:hypothetical protein
VINTTQWPKEKGQTQIYKTLLIQLIKDQATRTSLKTRGELRCSGMVGSSCSICGTRCVTLVTNTVIRHEWGKDPIAIMTNGTDLWYRCSVTVNKIKLNKNSFQQHFSYIVAVSFIGEETRVPGKNHRPVASHWQTLSNNVASRTPLSDRLFELATSEVIV